MCISKTAILNSLPNIYVIILNGNILDSLDVWICTYYWLIEYCRIIIIIIISKIMIKYHSFTKYSMQGNIYIYTPIKIRNHERWSMIIIKNSRWSVGRIFSKTASEVGGIIIKNILCCIVLHLRVYYSVRCDLV